MAQKILVLGSSNADLIFRVPRFHQPGETITAENLITAFGGKGANLFWFSGKWSNAVFS